MKLKLPLALLLQACLYITLPAQEMHDWKQLLQRDNANFFEICADAERLFEQEKSRPETAESEEPEDEGSAYNQFSRWKWFWESRVNPDGTFPDIRPLANLRKFSGNKAGVQNRNASQDCGWQMISQTTCTGGYSGMGRTTSIAFHPTDPNTYYVGGQSGGVWKTTDGGVTYMPISEGLPYNSASNLVVDHNDPEILYLANGDYAGAIYYTGIYKSYDGGQNWEPTGLSWSLTQNITVYQMAQSPKDPAVLIVAASNGLWRTDDGGDTWTLVRPGSYSDLEFHTGNGDIVYAAYYTSGTTSNIYKSTDGGINWNQLSNFGLPNNRVRISVSPANPDVIAAMCISGGTGKFFYSSDGGQTFESRQDCPESDVLILSPTNANQIYCGGVNVHRSSDQGNNWVKASHWHGGTADPVVHADQRNVAWQPVSNRIFFCNDGGIWRYDEQADDWQELSNGLIITQFYHIAVAQTDELFMIGGTQDNGGRKRVAPGEWEPTNGGDAMEVAIDYTNADIIYTTYIYGQLYRSLDRWTNDTGYRISNNLPGQTPDHDLNGSWVAPYQLDPQNPNAIVLGYADVYRSTNRGTSWTKISNNLTGNANSKLDALTIAPSDPNTIYTSNNAVLYKTTNLGANWTTHSVPNSANITSITVHPEKPEVLYITRGTFSAGNKVFRSDDGGVNWTNISGSLPNVPTNTLYLDLAADGSFTLFVGNDLGVWYRKSTMSDWVGMNQNMPITVVSDLELQKSSRKLRAGTYGRGIWEYDLGHLPGKDFSICTEVNRATICLPASFSTTISANAWENLGGPISLSLTDVPAGATASLSADELAADGTAMLDIDLPAGLSEGEYSMTILAVSNGDTATATLRLTLVSNDFSSVKNLLPADGSVGVSRWPLLRWNGAADANSYDVELATNPAFEPATIFKSYTGLKVDSLQWNLALDEGRVYYWRIRPVNSCGASTWTEPFVFSTAAKTCLALESTDVPKPITANGTPTVESKIKVFAGGPISELKVKNFEGNHQFFKDLSASIISPGGKEVFLFENKCGSYSGNFRLGFEDAAPNAFGCPPPQNGNPYRPEGKLSDFQGEDAAGDWILRVKDKTTSSGGQINGFAIEFCSDIALNPPVLINNNALQLAPGSNAPISTDLLLAEDADTGPGSLIFTLMSTPVHGELQRAWAGALKVGDQFSQADIDNGAIRYFDYGTGSLADQFRFSVSDGEGGLLADTFRIAPFALGTDAADATLDFFLAPNPTSGQVFLQLTKPLPSNARIGLTNLAGQQLRSWKWDAGTQADALDLSGLANGIYLISVQSGNAVSIKKIVKNQ